MPRRLCLKLGTTKNKLQLMLQEHENIAESLRFVLEERSHQQIAEHIVDVSGPQILPVPHERCQD